MSRDEDWEKTFLAKQCKSSATTMEIQQPVDMSRAQKAVQEGWREKREGIPENPTVAKLGDLVQNKLLAAVQISLAKAWQLPEAGVSWGMRNEGFNLGCTAQAGTALTCPVPAATLFPQVQQIPSIDSGARGFYCV